MKLELDSTTKNVVIEVMRECSNKGVQVDENFATYYAQLLILNPIWCIAPDALPDRNSVHKFVKHCLEIFSNQKCPSIITLKMQLYFMNEFDDKINIIARHRNELKQQVRPLLTSVVEAEVKDEKKENGKLYKKVVYLVTFYAGLGNPTEKEVYSEAEAALRSVFSEEELKQFLTLAQPEKEAQIVELTDLVTGIRLFNRDCDKGGRGIEDLPALLADAIDVTTNDVNKSIEILLVVINKLTTATDNACAMLEYMEEEENTEEDEHSTLKCDLPAGVTEEDLEHIKDMLIMCRQYELFIRKILAGINSIEDDTLMVFKKLTDALTEVHETVRYRIAIPTTQVFPLFIKLAKIWYQIQDQAIILSHYNEIMLNLQTYMKEINANENVIKLLVGPTGTKTDVERLESTTGLVLDSIKNNDAYVLDTSQIKNFDKIDLQYLGFCAWKFVQTNGGLIPGNPNMGIVKVHNLHYVFSSPQAARQFGKDPIRCILSGLALARQKPELIYFLQLIDQLVAVREIEELVVQIPEGVSQSDAEVETDLHPIPTHIDEEYMWNIWDWKRQALLLADLSRRATHSTQTYLSKAHENVRTQTQFTKDFSYQTKKDNYSNVPKMNKFIYGLRGRKDDVQHVLDLTRPVDE